MDWQQKMAAIQAFAGHFDVALRMRKPGDWYVEAGMSIGGNGMLLGTYGNGSTPEAAIEDHWRQYAEEMPADRYAVASGTPYRRGRWNGFMWDLLTDEEAQDWIENHRQREAPANA